MIDIRSSAGPRRQTTLITERSLHKAAWSRLERMNSPLEIREVRLRGLE
ncbi:MAG TPA: hypothetical protein VLK84_26535 [Longimicrobium sp.]|nr:hypothetical protein [Longimicrobium sp.]